MNHHGVLLGKCIVAASLLVACGGTLQTGASTDANRTQASAPTQIDVDGSQLEPALNIYSPSTSTGQGGTGQLLLERLSLIDIDDEYKLNGYDRDDWPLWVDYNDSGCDTRKDVLRQQLIDSSSNLAGGDCAISEGLWYSSYDESYVTQASDLEIDHIVALREAFESGASNWDEQTRREFANDPLNLVAVTRSTNRSKSDNDVADWRPPQNVWCALAGRVIDVKIRYSLTVDAREFDALWEMVATCDSDAQLGLGEPASPSDITAALSRESSEISVATTQPPNPGNTKNCSDFATYAEAKTWFERYFPAYGDVAKLDADGDGEPCESLP